MSRRIVVLGATSKLAFEICRLAAAEGRELLLVARNAERLASVAGRLAEESIARIDSICADLAEIASHEATVAAILEKMPDFDTVVLAYGSLGDPQRTERDADYALAEINTNFTSAVSLLTRLAPVLERRGGGCMAIVTSVAGDRARRSNYVYGTAKGALALFAQGLRARLHSSGVRVLTIKPGLVATPMTAHRAPSLFMADPVRVARSIYREIEHGHREVLYVPAYWRFLMFFVAHLPEKIAKRIKM